MNLYEKIKKCKHKWENKIIQAKNMNKKDCLWLIHRCSKCGAEGHHIAIGTVKELKKGASLRK